jgi:hypothetical protein
MNRRNFFKKIGVASVATIIIPHVLLAEVPVVVAPVVTDGSWHQARRGRVISYNRPGGLTKEHIREAVEYVFREENMKPLPKQGRFINFHIGRSSHWAHKRNAYIINGITYST